MLRSPSGVLRMPKRTLTIINTDDWITRKSVELSNDVEMPNPVFGTREHRGHGGIEVIKAAIKTGYRHLDLSTTYANLSEVREAIKGVPRGEIWLSLKINGHGYDHVQEAFRKATAELGVDYIDLVMLEWPGTVSSTGRRTPADVRRDSWHGLQTLYSDRKCRAIGVSNFSVAHLRQLLPVCEVVPHVCQMEFHPLNRDEELIRLCRKHKIQTTGHLCLGGGRMVKEEVVRYCAGEVEKPECQVVLRFALQHGIVPCCSSRNPAHMALNYDIFRFQIRDRYFRRMNKMNKKLKYDWDGDNVE